MSLSTIGKWVFIIGLVVCVIAGLFIEAAWVIWVLVILGIIVGILNVTGEDTRSFLLASIAFVLSATALNTIPLIGGIVTNILGYVAAFVSGAMIVVALKALFETARD
jgi:hypothetical protein